MGIIDKNNEFDKHDDCLEDWRRCKMNKYRTWLNKHTVYRHLMKILIHKNTMETTKTFKHKSHPGIQRLVITLQRWLMCQAYSLFIHSTFFLIGFYIRLDVALQLVIDML